MHGKIKLFFLIVSQKILHNMQLFHEEFDLKLVMTLTINSHTAVAFLRSRCSWLDAGILLNTHNAQYELTMHARLKPRNISFKYKLQ